MTDALTITVKADTRDGVRAVNELREALAETQEQARNVFAKGLSESLPEQLQDVARGFGIARDSSQTFTTRLQAGVGATLIAKNAVMELGTRLIDVARAFGENAAAIEQEQRALRALGTTFDSVRAATSGTTTATEALSMRQTLLRAGLSANHDVMARLSRLGREYAQTYGGTATEAVNTFVGAIQSGDATALQPFGVRLNNAKNATDRLAQAVDQLGARYSQVQAAGRTAAESQAAFERGLTRLRQNALEGVNSALLGLPGLIHRGVTALGDMVQTERGVEDATDRASRAMERQAEATRTTATATAALTSELSKADEQLKAFSATLEDAPDYTMRANETFQDAVARASQQAVNAIGRARRTRGIQAAVSRSLGRLSAEERAAAGLPPLQQQQRYRKDLLAAEEEAKLERERLLDAQTAEAADLEEKRRQQRIYEQEQAEESVRTQQAGFTAAGEAASATLPQLREQMRVMQRNRDLGAQIGDRFGGSRTLEEQMVAPIQGAADSVKGAFDTMASGLGSFMDTLIESPERAGEAAVQLAKNVLKGLAMMALQKSLFSTAEGIVALATPGMQASAAGHFTAAGIYAGVAAASGAAAAGIGAAARGAQAAPPPSAGASGQAGPPSLGSGRSSGGSERPMIVLNVNGSVLDQGGLEDAIVRGMRGARARGMA